MKRTVRLLAVPVLSVLLVTACGATPVRAGAAATVGDERITASQVAAVVDRGLADPQAAQQLGTDRPAFQRQVLTRLLTRELLTTAAQERGVEVTEGEVDARVQEFSDQLGGREQLETQAAQSGIAVPDLRPFLRDLTLTDKLADDLVADEQVPAAELRALYQQSIAQFDQVVARHILVASQAEAQQILTQVRADPSRFASIAEARSLDEGSKVRGGELDPAGRGAYVAEFENALFSAEEGEYGVVRTQFGFHVYNLLERRTTSLAEATPQLRRLALQAQREEAVGALLRETAADEEVRVNPRYGRWDAQQVQVVEAESSVSTPGPGGGADVVAPDPLSPDGAPQEGAPQEAPVEEGAPVEEAPVEEVPAQEVPAPQPTQ